ncbi:hypothetical protein C8R44DRAFT_652692 [Mycena epipterygia]|nr:hypothetical protein C8R44DRAFT_652692 [Mycena epipterygia]
MSSHGVPKLFRDDIKQHIQQHRWRHDATQCYLRGIRCVKHFFTYIFGFSNWIPGINRLYNYVVMEALHNSGERFPEPACHPGTRTAILNELKSWSINVDPETALLWFHGLAGVGKSAIAQTFAGECHREGRLGASFFFRRGHPKRGTWHGLITTIAYQLAESVPEFLSPLQQAMETDKLAIGRSLVVQFQQLLVEPFRHMTAPPIIPVIVLDGLDECDDHTVQQQILWLFVGAIRDHRLPLRLIIISRPEPYLRGVLETEETLGICRHRELRADDSASEDIRIYLQGEFSRINSDYRARGIDLGPVWPAPDALVHLVEKSSGIFIYAATIIRFIGDEYRHPADRLNSVLRLDPQSTAPLDDLYTEILSVVPPDPDRLRILYTIWKGNTKGHLKGPEEIDVLLNLRRGTCRLALGGLHSLLNVPSVPNPCSYRWFIEISHASLGDYLGDSRRSGPWCISLQWLQDDHLRRLIRLLSAPLPTELGDRARPFYS